MCMNTYFKDNSKYVFQKKSENTILCKPEYFCYTCHISILAIYIFIFEIYRIRDTN